MKFRSLSIKLIKYSPNCQTEQGNGIIFYGLTKIYHHPAPPPKCINFVPSAGTKSGTGLDVTAT